MIIMMNDIFRLTFNNFYLDSLFLFFVFFMIVFVFFYSMKIKDFLVISLFTSIITLIYCSVSDGSEFLLTIAIFSLTINIMILFKKISGGAYVRNSE